MTETEIISLVENSGERPALIFKSIPEQTEKLRQAYTILKQNPLHVGEVIRAIEILKQVQSTYAGLCLAFTIWEEKHTVFIASIDENFTDWETYFSWTSGKSSLVHSQTALIEISQILTLINHATVILNS